MTFPDKITAGFDYDEALTLLKIAQSAYSGPENQPPPSSCKTPVPGPPDDWLLVPEKTPTHTTLLDNFWQVWQNQNNKKQYVIAVRGTVETGRSVAEDAILPLVKARWALEFDLFGFKIDFPFHLVRDEGDSPVEAGVHGGFALGMLLMLFTTDAPLFSTLSSFGSDEEVYITGHSQGASVALLITSLVLHSKKFFNRPSYKTYVYAPAKPGNDHYSYDLDQIASARGFCYSIVNSQDWVPQIPLTLEGPKTLNRPNPLLQFDGRPESDIPAVVQRIITDLEGVRSNIFGKIEDELQQLIEKVEQHLHLAKFGVAAKELTDHPAAPETVVGKGPMAGLLGQIRNALLPSINYAKAGAVVPVFGDPGPNPEDPTDSFWQHHLCNYVQYLERDYGPSAG